MAKNRSGAAASKPGNLGMADVEWYGQANCDQFFELHNNEVFRGVGHNAVLLPPHSVPVSRSPNSGGAVIEAFAHGLAYGDMMTVFIGYLAFGALVLVFPLCLLLLSTWSTSFSVFGALIDALLLAAFGLLLRFDLIGYRYQPTLFDRRAGKVHIFKDNTRLFSWWPLWGGGGQHQVLSYDWSCVRGQVTRFRTFTGTVAQENAALQFIVLAGPKETQVIGRFGLGLTSNALAVQPLLNTWEHIRRFMEHEGPLFVEGDGPNEALFQLSLGACLCFGQPFIGPGSAHYWKNPDWGAVLWQVFALPMFPLTMFYGLIRWASFHIKSEPAWPPEILASVGGASLRGRDLHAWRSVVPSKPKAAPALRALGNRLSADD